MKKRANARFTIKNWDEKPYSEGQDLPRLTRASVTKTFSGIVPLRKVPFLIVTAPAPSLGTIPQTAAPTKEPK